MKYTVPINRYQSSCPDQSCGGVDVFHGGGVKNRPKTDRKSLLQQIAAGAFLLVVLLWPGRTPADILRIATWNIYLLFDETSDAAAFPPGRIPRTEADFRNLASVMARIDADIWALQEVESIQALDRLTKYLPGRYMAAISSRTGRALKTAVLIRAKPDLQVERLPDFSALDLARLRNALVLQVQVGELGFSMMVVHLQSGCFGPESETPDCDSWVTRREQLRLLNRWLREQLMADPSRKIVALGDFNQRFVPGSQGWSLLTDGVPLTAVDTGWKNDCWFYDWPEYPLIDHIVITESLIPYLVTGSFQQPDLEANYPSLGDQERDRLMRVISDHCPLAADFRY